MKKLLQVSAVVLLLVVSSACQTIKYTEGGQEVEKSTRVLHIIGLVPVGNDEFKTGPAYVEKFEFVDYLISGFTFGILQARTVEKQ